MSEATLNPVSYHGVKPFDKVTGKMLAPKEQRPTFPKVFGSAIHEMAQSDPSIVVITPAMPAGSCLTSMMQEFPDRCIDVGIAEGHSVTFGGGIAKGGKHKVVVSIYSTFLQRAFDNLYHDVCIQELPVIFAIDRGGIAGGDGITHNGIYDIGFLSEMPNMVIAQPRDGQVLKELLRASFNWNSPGAIRYPNLPTDAPSQDLVSRPIGKAEIIAHGEEICIVSLGHMVDVAIELKERLSDNGYNATIIDPIYVKPLDEELFDTIFGSHQTVITLEEHSLRGGLGSILNSFIVERGYHHLTVVNYGVPDHFVHHGSHGALMEELGLTAGQIHTSLLQKEVIALKRATADRLVESKQTLTTH